MLYPFHILSIILVYILQVSIHFYKNMIRSFLNKMYKGEISHET